jgi:hypothetical protein
MESQTHGFVITRHVNSEKTNKYWNECYSCIRKFYPTNTVIIIDDNSKYEYVTPLPDTPPLTNVFFIQSEFQGRGELLPYYYLNKYKLFPRAIIIHDSVFIQQPIPLTTTSKTPTLIWNFQHHWETHPDITCDIKNLISKLNPQHTQRLLELYEKKDQWTGCFGVMSMINTEYISSTLDQTYHFFNLLEHVTTRTHRCCLERVFGLICSDSIQKPSPTPTPTLLGDIHHYINQYCNWEYDFDQYMNDKNNNMNMKLEQFPMIKTHSGR